MKTRRFIESFRYALNGIRAALREERNMRSHLCTGAYVFFFSTFYDFGKTEYMLLVLMVCGVLALELMNSSVERAVDKPSPKHYWTAGAAKDMAAGSVLMFSIGCAVCGVLLFWDPAAFRRICTFFITQPLALAALAASLVLAWRFIYARQKDE